MAPVRLLLTLVNFGAFSASITASMATQKKLFRRADYEANTKLGDGGSEHASSLSHALCLCMCEYVANLIKSHFCSKLEEEPELLPNKYSLVERPRDSGEKC